MYIYIYICTFIFIYNIIYIYILYIIYIIILIINVTSDSWRSFVHQLRMIPMDELKIDISGAVPAPQDGYCLKCRKRATWMCGSFLKFDVRSCHFNQIPSGEPTKSNGKWLFIVDFPIKHGDFPLLC